MKKELANKYLFDDFVSKSMLTDNERDVLIRYIRNDSIVKIAEDTQQGTTTISRVISTLKDKYSDYKKMELAKMSLLLGNK